jgi:hypothetical protein
MLKISLNNPESGWAYAHLRDGDRELTVTGPCSPIDVLRDLVDAVQSLQTANVADCCWFQEPGELHWSLRRTDEEIEVEILSLPEVLIPSHHRGDAISVFKAREKWVTLARQLLSSLESIKTDLGPEGYERRGDIHFRKKALKNSRMPFRRRLRLRNFWLTHKS